MDTWMPIESSNDRSHERRQMKPWFKKTKESWGLLNSYSHYLITNIIPHISPYCYQKIFSREQAAQLCGAHLGPPLILAAPFTILSSHDHA